MAELTPEQWSTLFDRATCPAGNHQRPTVIVHSPGFYDEPDRGVGTASTACAVCIDDTVAIIRARFGGATVRQFDS